jgi:hypothetical protein
VVAVAQAARLPAAVGVPAAAGGVAVEGAAVDGADNRRGAVTGRQPIAMSKASFMTEDAMTTCPLNRQRKRSFRECWLGTFAAGVFAVIAVSAAQAQQAYRTPDEAINTLVTAVKANDAKGILTVLGRDGSDIISSGDDVADEAARKRFVEAFDAKHQVDLEGDSKATLVIGSQDWPFPIPLVRGDGGWRFDTAAGRQEILFRRIGRNELNAIQASLAYVDAQNEYASVVRDSSGLSTYAQRIVSSPGKKDGLYWPTQAGEAPSPLGELIAEATAQGYRVEGGRNPYHGYYYKILTRQGPNAPGGAIDYVTRGKMIGGFALVAYPAEYGNSGVMTFLVNHDGRVLQKDLGPRTARIAGRMSAYDPDHTWRPATTEAPAKADAGKTR